MKCSWQLVGDEQWFMISAHFRALAGSVPSSVSEACPENDTFCPTCHRSVDDGESMTGTGAVLPTLIRTVAVSFSPSSSVTFSVTLYVPFAVYVRVGVADVESPNTPLPSRSQS